MDDAHRESPTDGEVERMFLVAEKMSQLSERRKYLRGRALCVLTLLAYAGLRRAELLALDVSDLWRETTPWKVYVRVGKGAQPRQVELGEAAQAYLDEWLAVRRRWCFIHHHGTDALLPVDSTRRLSNRGLDSIWAEILELAEIKRKITPHGMRHWYGSRVQETEGLKTAQELLGHKRPETTLGYLKTSSEKKARAANAFGRPPVRTPESGEGSGSLPDTTVREPRRLRRVTHPQRR